MTQITCRLFMVRFFLLYKILLNNFKLSQNVNLLVTISLTEINYTKFLKLRQSHLDNAAGSRFPPAYIVLNQARTGQCSTVPQVQC